MSIAAAYQNATLTNQNTRVVLAVLYLALGLWICCDSVVAVHNAVRQPQDGAHVFIGWRYEHEEFPLLQVVLVFVPRLLIITTSGGFMAAFLHMLLYYTQEPAICLRDIMPESQYPSVDVFLPRYKESWDLFKATLTAALSMNYPKNKLKVYVLDDGRQSPLCQKLESDFRLGSPNSNLGYIQRSNGGKQSPPIAYIAGVDVYFDCYLQPTRKQAT